jgi:hypothetical protein
MSLSLINEVWKLLKPSIEHGDVDEAAETLVNFLVDEAYASTHEIKNAFRGDKEIKEALDYYLETPESGHYHDYEDDEDIYDDYHNDYDDDYE